VLCIENVNYIKYLELYIDSPLKWKKHIDYLVKLIRTFFHILLNLRHIVDEKHLRILYIHFTCTIIYTLWYIESWGCTYDVHLSKIKSYYQ